MSRQYGKVPLSWSHHQNRSNDKGIGFVLTPNGEMHTIEGDAAVVVLKRGGSARFKIFGKDVVETTHCTGILPQISSSCAGEC